MNVRVCVLADCHEGVRDAGASHEFSDNFASTVDPVGFGRGSAWHIDDGVGAIIVDEALRAQAAGEIPDNLAMAAEPVGIVVVAPGTLMVVKAPST
jgi:hypothetical protein